MSDPVAFDSQSPRFGLPFLFPAQAQKEFYINEAYALIDSLLHPILEGTANTPPAQPADGECWLVDAAPNDAWTGQPGAIACYQSATWLFAIPRDGMRAFDRSRDIEIFYDSGWQVPEPVTLPTGGTNVDAEARAAVSELIQALVTAGLITSQ